MRELLRETLSVGFAAVCGALTALAVVTVWPPQGARNNVDAGKASAAETGKASAVGEVRSFPENSLGAPRQR